MSDVADIERTARQRWAAPGGSHDRLVRFLRVALPASIGVLTVALIAAPLTMTGEISFVLAKDSVDMARERLRIQAATYRGEDSKGQPFILRAGSAVQKSSKDPIVKITDLDGQITLADGPATIAAHQGHLRKVYESLGISRKTLYEKMQKHGLDRRLIADDAEG